MTWNYRILKGADAYGQPFYALHKVYYDETGKVIRWTEEPTHFQTLRTTPANL